MFKCLACGHSGFELMLSPAVKDTVTITTNEHGDVIIAMGAQRMVADLGFMNQFATCSGCQAQRQWSYHYPGAEEVSIDEGDE